MKLFFPRTETTQFSSQEHNGTQPKTTSFHSHHSADNNSVSDTNAYNERKASQKIKELINNNNLRQAEALLQTIQTPNQHTFQPLLNAYANRANLDAVQQLFNTMKARRVTPNKYHYNTFIKCAVKANNIAKASAVFEQMQSVGVQPNVVTYTTLINAFARANNLNQALQIFEQMLRLGLQPDVVTYTTLINALARANNPDQALKIFKRMPQRVRPDVVTYNTLINAFAQAKQPEQALQLFEQMQQVGLKPDVVTYNTLINAFAQANNPDQALKIFEQMWRLGWQPDVVTYTTLINAFAKANNPNQALKIFKWMPQGVQPDVVTYNTLINAFAQASNPNQALKIFKWMPQGLQPDVVTYTTLINALARANNPDQALQIFEQMWRLRLQPDVVTYNTLINAFAQANNPDQALKIFKRMPQGLRPDVEIYNTLINAFAQAKQPKQALQIFEEVQQVGLQPTIVTYSTLINAFVQAKQPEQALTIFEKMQQAGIEPTVVTYNTLINAFAEANTPDPDQACHIYKEMIKKGITPDAITSSTLLKAFVEGGRAREGLMAIDPKNPNTKLDEISYQILVLTHIKLRESGFAEYWLCKMMKAQYKPSKKLFSTLVQSFLQAGDTNGALRAEERMRKEGYMPNPRGLLQGLQLPCCPATVKVPQQSAQIGSTPLPPATTESSVLKSPVLESPALALQATTVASDPNSETMLPQELPMNIAPLAPPITKPVYHFILDHNQSLKCVQSGVENFALLTKFPIMPSAEVLIDPGFLAKFEEKRASLIETSFEVNPIYEEALTHSAEEKILPNGIEVRKVSANVGYGVFTTQRIKKGAILGEYTGKITTWDWLDEHEPDCSYSFECSNAEKPLFEAFAIDGCMVGNFTRFFNHGTCKQRNLRPVHYFNKTGPHILFEATRNIKEGEQLCFNYGPKYWRIKGITPAKM